MKAKSLFRGDLPHAKRFVGYIWLSLYPKQDIRALQAELNKVALSAEDMALAMKATEAYKDL